MRKKIIKALAVFLFLTGAAVLFYPMANEMYGIWREKQLVKKFEERKNPGREQGKEEDLFEPNRESYSDLREDMKMYNRKIYRNQQSKLKDAWNYEQEIFSMKKYGLDSDMIGYIESDDMDICLPLYIGASSEHLASGAAVLGQTSMPIGGKDTNCVVAGHRGWKGIPMFRNIEALQPGDIIWVTNLWERLAYRVVRITVITPDDIDAVKIVDGQDMLTLVTCHPYTKNYQRYVVYCTRTYDAVYEGKDQSNSDRELNHLLDRRQREHPEFISSSAEIRRERILTCVGAAGGMVLLIILVVLLFATHDKKKK